MAKAFKPKFTFGVAQWKAKLYRINHARKPVRHRIQRGRISGTTWPGEEMAIAERPRVIHNQQRA